MRSRVLTTVLALLVIVGGGLLRLPFERDLTADFRQRELLGKPIKIGVRERIGQDKWSVALAGLRTLVAAFAGLRATEQFSNTDWAGLSESMETAVELAPHTEYYWDIGGWHMAYNASSSYRFDRKEKDWSHQLAEAEGRRWVERGRDFYERGIRNNPENWRLAARLGVLYSDWLRYPDDAKAVEAYRHAVETGRASQQVVRLLLMARARAGEDSTTVLRDLEQMLAEDRENRVPTLLCLDFVLRSKLGLAGDPLSLAQWIFGSEPRALRLLGTYFANVSDRLPQDGVEAAVRLLEMRAYGDYWRHPLRDQVPWLLKGRDFQAWLRNDGPLWGETRGINPADPRSYIRQREDAEMLARNRRLGR